MYRKKHSIYRIWYNLPFQGTHWRSCTDKGGLLYLLVCLLGLCFAELICGVLYKVFVCILWINADNTTDHGSEKRAFDYSFFSVLFRTDQAHFPHLPCHPLREMFLCWWVCGSLHLKEIPFWSLIFLTKPHPPCKFPYRCHLFHKEFSDSHPFSHFLPHYVLSFLDFHNIYLLLSLTFLHVVLELSMHIFFSSVLR